MKNCGYRHAEDQIIELRDSEDVLYFFPLRDEFALGEEVLWQRYDSDFLQPNWIQPTQPGPLALWNLNTGERSTHAPTSVTHITFDPAQWTHRIPKPF